MLGKVGTVQTGEIIVDKTFGCVTPLQTQPVHPHVPRDMRQLPMGSTTGSTKLTINTTRLPFSQVRPYEKELRCRYVHTTEDRE